MCQLELVGSRALGKRQKLECYVKDPGMQARLGSGKRTPHVSTANSRSPVLAN
jgi:hypothetical protein